MQGRYKTKQQPTHRMASNKSPITDTTPAIARAAVASLPRRSKRGRPTKAEASERARIRAAAEQRITEQAQENAAAISPEPQSLTLPTAPKFANGEIAERIKRLEMPHETARARNFLTLYAQVGYNKAMTAAGLAPFQLEGMKNNPEFAEIYNELRRAHDGHTVARTVQTLERCANGEYIPTPGALPPDMRAASILLPALDPRFKANAPSSGNQVQINISL